MARLMSPIPEFKIGDRVRPADPSYPEDADFTGEVYGKGISDKGVRYYIRWEDGSESNGPGHCYKLADDGPIQMIHVGDQTHAVGDDVTVTIAGQQEPATIVEFKRNQFSSLPYNAVVIIRFQNGSTGRVWLNQIVTNHTRGKGTPVSTDQKTALQKIIADAKAALAQAEADLKKLEFPEPPGDGSYRYQVRFTPDGKLYTYLVEVVTGMDGTSKHVYVTGVAGRRTWRNFVQDVRALRTVDDRNPYIVTNLAKLGVIGHAPVRLVES